MAAATNKYCVGNFDPSPINSDQCVRRCPTERGFQRINENGQLVCRYRPKPDVKFTIEPVPALTRFGSDGSRLTLDDLQRTDVELYTQYRTQEANYTTSFAQAMNQIGTQDAARDAFASLQRAENTRDTDPEGYQRARTSYYTLLYGEEWKDEEARRISSAEVDPKITHYKQRLAETTERRDDTNRTLEVVNAVKDNVVTMRQMFEEQVERLRNAVMIEKKKRITDAIDRWSFLDGFLNIVLMVVLVFAAIVVGYKVYQTRMSATAYPYSSYSYRY